ncbi:MAG TPA: class I SAM-dependent methyltransferase [Candidatus Nanoarchaeia archaeon]|nr:class I SAM-dependent methyltransferase [Candidatus Nanoarchaeia archaeon]
MNQERFWDEVWNSDSFTDKTELIDHLMHKSAVDFSYQLLGDIKDKRLLEIACGSGAQALFFCREGAELAAIDISEKSISETRKVLTENNFRQVQVKKMDARALSFQENTFDLVYFNSLLMHIKDEDQDKVIQESLRVLKPGGKLIFIETLKHWLFAFPYRTFSPYRHSRPEYIPFKFLKKIQAKHREFYLFSCFFLFLFFLIKNKRIVSKLFHALSRIDNFLMQVIPPLRKLSWVTVAWIQK